MEFRYGDKFFCVFIIPDKVVAQSCTCEVGDPVRGSQVEMETFITILSLFIVKQMLQDNLYLDASRGPDHVII